jgi:hypothetical protein
MIEGFEFGRCLQDPIDPEDGGNPFLEVNIGGTLR